jgi:YidC/Oxa1 family membrane protein insertase
MMGWFYLTMPSEEEIAEQRRQQALADSLSRLELLESPSEIPQLPLQQQPRAAQIEDPVTAAMPALEGMFSAFQDSVQTEFVISTPLYRAEFTNKGAGPAQFTLLDHLSWSGQPIQMIADTSKSAYNAGFLTTENYNVDTDRLLFNQLTTGTGFTLTTGDSRELSYALPLGDGRQMIYTYTFYGDKYEVDLDINFVGISDYIIGKAIDFGWTSRLNFTEKDPIQEALETKAFLYAGGELEEHKADKFNENNGYKELNVNGNIDWVATKTKFFTQIIKPTTATEGAYLTGQITGEVDDPLTKHRYTSSITSDIPDNGTISYRLYIGPMKYYDVRGFEEHAFDMVKVSYGWLSWFSNPFVRFIVIPFFTFLGGYISNYGVLIIIFAVLVKLILTPLTLKSYKSMAAMRELQPQMQEMQEKYKNNPQKQQKATMDLYRKNKVNPVGGCLPMLLQFPILITLWRFFQNSILLRQESFLWVSDLSAPDYIISLPFSIPFLGTEIAGLVLLMTASMVLQSKLTASTSGSTANNPMAQQMKIMQYFLPFMLLFVFNNFASGLSLYYLIFNLLSIVQQLYINKSTHEAAVAKAK